MQFQNFACVHWLCHFHILSFIPLKGSVPYAELASLASVPLAQLKRVARMAILHNFLREPEHDKLAHSATSVLLVKNPGLLDWMLFMAEATSIGAAKLVEATEKWGSSTSKTQTAFNIAKNTDLPFFDFLAQTPDLRTKFAHYMKNVTASEGTKIDHLLEGFDWGNLADGATVVDVGGSNCHASIALATRFPQLRFVVQDLPDTIAKADALLGSTSPSVSSRITAQAHNFFSPQPILGAQVYLLRMILHDWPEAEAINILQNLLPALAANPGSNGSRLLIMDTVLPVPGDRSGKDAATDPIEEAMLRARDLTMLEAFNSLERELEAWEHLIDQAWKTDKGNHGVKLELIGNRKPFGSNMNVLEVAVVKQDANTENGVNNNVNGNSNTSNGGWWGM